MSRLTTGKTLFLLGVLVVLIIIGLHFSAGNTDELTPFESTTRETLSPVQRVVSVVSGKVTDFFAFPVRLYKLSEHNRQLEQQVTELQEKLAEYNEIKAENVRLKEQLSFKTSLAGQLNTVSAEVIGRAADNWFGIAIINKGSANGIQQDMAVITPAGLVGRVTNVTNHTAEVLLITDPRSGVGCLVQENRAPGIVEGVAGGSSVVNMVHIPSDLAPKKGNRVVTSGFGSVFPKGIPVGTVHKTRREESGMFKMATLKTFVDFNRLEEVLVITSSNVDPVT
ncbi:Cell shape-determining protein MreC precursor [Sporotomaculum syntrophicum]|uniref:Cell shape-determining protein MreC n=1 Tax=Sporotomaculum syntrophicum TaxID=182264 RepID=A0A9D2WQL0_9FIRM|nr:rod shape-determining protein MreC [Sporotomaculum syntrophicum]KAF1085629.1 Cell shape-determining protein MreC precursor [Sporotomaculum syntrophicum]